MCFVTMDRLFLIRFQPNCDEPQNLARLKLLVIRITTNEDRNRSNPTQYLIAQCLETPN
jgi:hypothetical protein